MTIYKRTSTGATQQWHQEISGSQYRTVCGQVGGKLVVSEWTQCEGTNIGRANERTPEEQAIFEVEANYKKKLDKEYHESIDTIDTPKNFLPMLAKEYSPVDFTQQIFAQPKLDGMRCIATAYGLFSRNGKPIVGVPHISEALKEFFTRNHDAVLDGELYNHEYRSDFNTIISNAKKTKPTEEDLVESARVIEYHIYDWAIPARNFSFRVEKLRQEWVGYLFATHLKLVETKLCETQKILDDHFDMQLSAGYEGQMVRLDDYYMNKRTDSLLKRKVMQTEEFILVDILEGLGNWAGYAKIARLLTKDGVEFGAGIAGKREWCRQVLEDREAYLGTQTTVKFANLTPDGIPRFPIVKEFSRNDAS